jgi:hypothetical protein
LRSRTFWLRSKPLKSFVEPIYQLLLLLAARRVVGLASFTSEPTMSLRDKPLQSFVNLNLTAPASLGSPRKSGSPFFAFKNFLASLQTA